MQDGLFSFANLVNSGCALWEEPFISPELADTAKLVLEGRDDVDVAIKHKGSVRLNKRVPIIITTNTPLHKYCSSDKDAFNERCIMLYCNTYFTKLTKCNANHHFCSLLDSGYRSDNPFFCEERFAFSDESEGSGPTTSKVQNVEENLSTSVKCEGFHNLTRDQVLSFIVYILYTRKWNFKLIPKISYEEHEFLKKEIEYCFTLLCTNTASGFLTSY